MEIIYKVYFKDGETRIWRCSDIEDWESVKDWCEKKSSVLGYEVLEIR